MSNKKSNNTLLIVGGAAALYLLWSNSQASTVVPVTSTAAVDSTTTDAVPSTGQVYPYLVANAPAIPAAFDKVYYLTYIRPAMVLANSNLNNPAYNLSSTDVTNYLNNYLDLRQELPNWIGKTINKVNIISLPQAAQWHWKQYGAAEQRTFLPLPWSDMAAYVPAPVSPKSSSGSSWIGPAISAVATIAVAVAGPNDVQPMPQLNDGEINLVVTSGAVIKKILPFYLQVDPTLVNSINNRLDSILSQYAT